MPVLRSSGGDPLRVSVVTETYPPEINGVAVTVSRLIEQLLSKGHQVQLIRPRQPAREPRLQDDVFTEILTRGFPVPCYPELQLGLPAGRRLTAEWARVRPDVVHLATPGPLAWSALRTARRAAIPVVSEFRTNFHTYSRHYGVGWLGKAILAGLRSFHNQTLGTMVPTHALRLQLEAAGFRSLTVVARGVDAGRFHPRHRSNELRRQWGAGPETLVVIGVGRLALEKNLGLLASTFKSIRNVRPDSRLVLVGDGPARGRMVQWCPEAVFAGKRSGHDLSAHYASADLLLFPSLTETFGNVTLEGMASGLGVVAFDYGAAHEFLQSGQSGWTVPYGDETAFLRIATTVAAESGVLNRIRVQARREISHRGWDAIVEKVEDLYQKALKQQPGMRSFRAMTPGIPKGRLTPPRYLTGIVAWNCNARCIMCDGSTQPSPNSLASSGIEGFLRQFPRLDALDAKHNPDVARSCTARTPDGAEGHEAGLASTPDGITRPVPRHRSARCAHAFPRPPASNAAPDCNQPVTDVSAGRIEPPCLWANSRS
ncbi:MAG: glycosyltransferase family 1 protein [Verrucomicrobiae bacterium]|nr:glycosyltransferase family 1 protein [Verrucomicrobiae bacterium]